MSSTLKTEFQKKKTKLELMFPRPPHGTSERKTRGRLQIWKFKLKGKNRDLGTSRLLIVTQRFKQVLFTSDDDIPKRRMSPHFESWGPSFQLYNREKTNR